MWRSSYRVNNALLVEVLQGCGDLVDDGLHVKNALGYTGDVVVGDDVVEAPIGTRKDDAVRIFGVDTIVEALDSRGEHRIRLAVIISDHANDITLV